MEKQRARRKLRNYLIDANYQLRVVVLLLVIVGLVMGALGYRVVKIIAQSKEISLHQLASLCHEDALPPASHEVNQRIVFGDEQAQSRADMRREYKGRYERARIKMSEQRGRCRRLVAGQQAHVIRRHQQMVVVMGIGGAAMCVLLFFYGILMTHRVAGPLHKMATLMEDLADGGGRDPSSLRKGDHLQGLYDRFKKGYTSARKALEDDVLVLQKTKQSFVEYEGEKSPSVKRLEQEVEGLLGGTDKESEGMHE